MRTLIIHPGSPKTATSTVQHFLLKNRSAIEDARTGLVLPEDIRGTEFLGRYLAAYRGAPEGDFADVAHAFFSKWSGKQKVICSEETFCHDFMPSKSLGLGGIDRAERAAELLSVSGFDKIKIVLTIRPQYEMLVSTYTHFVHRQRETRVFRDWLTAEVIPENVLWVPVVNAFKAKFGQANVKVISLSLARERGMAGYIAALMQAFGLDATGVRLDIETVHNPSPSMQAVDLCRLMNTRINSHRISKQVNTFLVKKFPVEEYGKFRPKWKPGAALAALYEKDHAEALCAD